MDLNKCLLELKITQFSVFENSLRPSAALAISANRTFERTCEKSGCRTDCQTQFEVNFWIPVSSSRICMILINNVKALKLRAC